jgi:surfactin synthase thioesterase subunit
MMSNATRANTPWLTKPKPDVRARRMRLFCFPYAGGSALIFRRWPSCFRRRLKSAQCTSRGTGRAYWSPRSRTFEASSMPFCRSWPMLSCPLTVFGGADDTHNEPEGLEAWREHTVGPFSRHMFDGDHFFINTALPRLLRALESALLAGPGDITPRR